MVRQLLQNYKSKKYSKYIAVIHVLLILLITGPQTTYAQPGGPPNPCGAEDQCPLDTWVIVLAVFAFLFTTVYLYRSQKRLIKIPV
ncbi:MAG: hypothetical protein JWQ79_144 [Mucilaginibacter sp.]|nr:hypothetical protein [Mucilaginibacter sp.]